MGSMIRPICLFLLGLLFIQAAPADARLVTRAFDRDEEPDLYIPDPGNCTSRVYCPLDVTVEKARVHLLIRHTWVGDLVISLRSPQGTTVVLRYRQGGSANDINTNYDLYTPSYQTMDVFRGQRALGEWSLRVEDRVYGEYGRLKGWQLQITYDEGARSATCQPLVGLGDSGAGAMELFQNASGDYAHAAWAQLPFSAYNRENGETRVAAGDVDGDGIDEVVVGLGPSSVSRGWVAVMDGPQNGGQVRAWLPSPFDPWYDSANGETWVATGDVDGDGRDEIVVGQGTYRLNGGRFAVFDDAQAGHKLLYVKRVPWAAYNAYDGAVRPACGDLDGDGTDEIVLGFSPFPGQGGYVAVYRQLLGGEQWQWLRLPWSTYNAASGGTRPACGDIDGDGRAELVVGLDSFPTWGGYCAIFDDAVAGHEHLDWLRVPHIDYIQANGETRPACGDTDGDGRDEVLVGLGTFAPNTSNVAVFRSDAASTEVRWIGIESTPYNEVNGEAWVTLGRFDRAATTTEAK